MNETITIRKATPEDAGRLLEIYQYYVLHTAISFEWEVPTVETFRARIEKTLKKYPYYVAEQGSTILGYSYAGPFVGRAAYDWSAELTIYLAPDARKHGLGRMLYTEMERALGEMGVLNLYACIGSTEVEDEYLTNNSEQFHTHMGFRKVGTFQRCGYKFDRWYDMIWMEKLIGTHGHDQKPVQKAK